MTAPGLILNQRFRLDRLVGQGGFARVFLSTDLLLDRQVAVKVLSPSQLGADTAPFLDRFAAEARLIARLEHPNILGLYDYGQSDDLAYLVMPYVAGGSLHDLRRRVGRFTPPQVAAYLRQVAAALDYAHRNNVVHRDIKPQNMLLRDDQLLVADFGIAKVLREDSSQSGTAIVGSASYMAPEQFQGRVGRATDIYALGCVIFELLTGAPPYPGPAERSMYGHVWGEIPRLTATLPDAPPALQAVLDRALAKQPEARFASAGALSDAFAAAIESPNEQLTRRIDQTIVPIPPPPLAVPPSTTAPLPPRPLAPPPAATPAPPGNRRLVIGLASAVVTLLILLGVGVVLFLNRPQPGAAGETPTPASTVVAAVPSVAPTAASASSAPSTSSGNPTATVRIAPTPASLISRIAIQLGGHTDRTPLSLWSPNGAFLVTASEDGTAIWWRKDGQLVRVLTGHIGGVRALVWSPDGQYLATGGYDGEIFIWQENQNDPTRIAGNGDTINNLAWSPDGKTLVATSSNVRFIQAGTWRVGNAIQSDSEGILMAWSPDGRLVAVAVSGGSLRLYRSDGGLAATLTDHTADVTGLSWSPDSARLASVGGNFQLWDASTLQRIAQPQGHTDQVTSVAWSRDSKFIATGAADSTVRLWQPDGTPVRTLAGHEPGVIIVAWLRDGTLVSADSAGILRWWSTDGVLASQAETSGCGVIQLAPAPVDLLVAVSQDCDPPQIWR